MTFLYTLVFLPKYAINVSKKKFCNIALTVKKERTIFQEHLLKVEIC